MTELPTRDEFANHLNKKFRVYFDAEKPTEVELTEVSELRETTRQKSFSLLFTAPKETPPFQGLYKIEHDALGALEISLEPVGRDEKGLYFEAFFNQIVTAANN